MPQCRAGQALFSGVDAEKCYLCQQARSKTTNIMASLNLTVPKQDHGQVAQSLRVSFKFGFFAQQGPL